MTRAGSLALLLALSACGRESQPRSAMDSARGEVTPSRTDTGMAGMVQSKMPGMEGMTAMDTPTTGKMSMPGMDHSKMAGMGTPKSANRGGSMPEMDHSKMPGMGTGRSASGGGMPGMDKSPMAGMGTSKASGRGMAGMKVGAANMKNMNMGAASTAGMTMGAPPVEPSAGEIKLDQLVAALLRDSLVRRRIRGDTALQRRWDAAAAQLILAKQPH